MATTKFDKYELYVGLNDKDTKTQLISDLDAYKMVYNEVAKRFDGATVFNANGVYKHDNGTVVIEHTIKIEIILFDKSKTKNDIKLFVDYLKDTLNQESVAVQHSKVVSDLW